MTAISGSPGQNGVYGSLNPASGDMQVYDAPKGRGPYGIATSPNGDVYYASLAGSYVGRIDPTTGEANCPRAANFESGRQTRLVRFTRPHLGQRMERRPGIRLRSLDRRLE